MCSSDGSHFKSFSTKITSEIQCGNVFSSCFQKSTKNLISQNLIVHDILGKPKILYNQIRKGLKNLGVLDQLEKNPDLFSKLFLTKEKLTSEEVMKVMKYDIVVQKKIKTFSTAFYKSVRNANCSSFVVSYSIKTRTLKSQIRTLKSQIINQILTPHPFPLP